MAKSYQARRRKRNHTGELTDKLVHIVDKYLQRQAEETRIYVVSTPCEEASTTATTHPQKRTSEEGEGQPRHQSNRCNSNSSAKDNHDTEGTETPARADEGGERQTTSPLIGEHEITQDVASQRGIKEQSDEDRPPDLPLLCPPLRSLPRRDLRATLDSKMPTALDDRTRPRTTLSRAPVRGKPQNLQEPWPMIHNNLEVTPSPTPMPAPTHRAIATSPAMTFVLLWGPYLQDGFMVKPLHKGYTPVDDSHGVDYNSDQVPDAEQD